MGNSRDGDEGRAGVTGVSGQSLPGRGEAGAKVMPGQTVAARPGSLTPEEWARGLALEIRDTAAMLDIGSIAIENVCAAAIRAAVAEEREAGDKVADILHRAIHGGCVWKLGSFMVEAERALDEYRARSQ